MNPRPDLSIIVLSWNVRDLLRACLASVHAAAETGRAPMEVIVVDNASTDGSADMVAAEFPAVLLIRNAANAGYAAANNRGIAASRGRHVALLNSDTLVPPTTFAELLAFMEANPNVGACSPLLQQPDGNPQPYAYGGDPSLSYLARRAAARFLLRRPLHDWRVEHTVEVDWVSGACLVVRREAIEAVGGLDESMFMYFEDNDWCRRIRRVGWTISYVPHVAITHIGGASLRQNPAARRAYYRSLERFYEKHYSLPAQGVLKLALVIYRFFTHQEL